MRTYSTDLRERVVAARARGHSAAEIARLFKGFLAACLAHEQ